MPEYILPFHITPVLLRLSLSLLTASLMPEQYELPVLSPSGAHLGSCLKFFSGNSSKFHPDQVPVIYMPSFSPYKYIPLFNISLLSITPMGLSSFTIGSVCTSFSSIIFKASTAIEETSIKYG